MSYAHYLKEIGRGMNGARELPPEDAQRLYAAMLDGGVPELELGAILLALRMKSESLSELLGFHQALSERVARLHSPTGKARTVVVPTYNGARSQPNLMPLVVLLLQRLGVPVLVHGTLDGNGRVASALVFRELGVLPCLTLTQAQDALDQKGLAFVPTALLSPGLANLLSLRQRLGVRNTAHTLAKIIDPFEGAGLRLVCMTHPDYLQKMRDLFLATGELALLMRGTEGEAYANPSKRPRIELYRDGAMQVLFEQEHMTPQPQAPQDLEAKAAAAWIRKALQGGVALPLPIVNQLACCLYGSGYCADFNEAKAIIAVELRSPLLA
jgi:anthranilate phosphoribosyltransferase